MDISIFLVCNLILILTVLYDTFCYLKNILYLLNSHNYFIILTVVEDSEPSNSYLVKQSCHDSGIDIRDPPVLSIPRKTFYSDADILLSESEFLPPVPVVPLSSDHLNDAVQLRKKKTTSVSFSLEDCKEQDTNATEVQKIDEQAEKQAQETKKNKV